MLSRSLYYEFPASSTAIWIDQRRIHILEVHDFLEDFAYCMGTVCVAIKLWNEENWLGGWRVRLYRAMNRHGSIVGVDLFPVLVHPWADNKFFYRRWQRIYKKLSRARISDAAL